MKRILTLLAAAILAAPCLSLAAVANDEVTSVKLKEADNTASQDTNSGSGVKTNHLQNKAVTGAKMADGTITATQLANGAVTDAKITGPISGAKLGAHKHAPSDLIGTIPVDKLATYSAELVVHSGPANGVNTFNTLSAAYAAAAPGSWTLIRVLPGTYAEPAGPIALNKSVVIEGSGARASYVQATFANNGSSPNSIIRDIAFDAVFTWGSLQLENVEVFGEVTVMQNLVMRGTKVHGWVKSFASADIRGCEIRQGSIELYTPAQDNYIVDTLVEPVLGANLAIYVQNNVTPGTAFPATTTIRNVTTLPTSATALGADHGINLRVTGSKLIGSYRGIYLGGPDTLEVRNSEIGGSTEAIFNNGAGPVSVVAASQLLGALPAATAPSVRLVNCYDANYNPIPNQ